MDQQSQLTRNISGFSDKDLSTTPPNSGVLYPIGTFVKSVISEESYWGKPSQCPHNDHLYRFKTPFASVLSSTTYGGPGSKYKTINEDSYFFGFNRERQMIAGVIDGAGGSEFGYLGGKLANQSLSQELSQGTSVSEAFLAADEEVFLKGRGGYATGVALTIDKALHVVLAAKGDSRALTLREGRILARGTTRMQSEVARQIELGNLPPHAIHTASHKNIIYSMIGSRERPLFETKFQGFGGDTIIMASDGLWDVVTDFEIQSLALSYHGEELQYALYQIAYARNNSLTPFSIEFSAGELHQIRPLFDKGIKTRGDNITVQVIELK